MKDKNLNNVVIEKSFDDIEEVRSLVKEILNKDDDDEKDSYIEIGRIEYYDISPSYVVIFEIAPINFPNYHISTFIDDESGLTPITDYPIEDCYIENIQDGIDECIDSLIMHLNFEY